MDYVLYDEADDDGEEDSDQEKEEDQHYDQVRGAVPAPPCPPSLSLHAPLAFPRGNLSSSKKNLSPLSRVSPLISMATFIPQPVGNRVAKRFGFDADPHSAAGFD